MIMVASLTLFVSLTSGAGDLGMGPDTPTVSIALPDVSMFLRSWSTFAPRSRLIFSRTETETAGEEDNDEGEEGDEEALLVGDDVTSREASELDSRDASARVTVG